MVVMVKVVLTTPSVYPRAEVHGTASPEQKHG
jgi:hypothetical protein